jgi:acyl dehydratase
MSRNLSGRWFEDLPVGLVIEHAVTRTVTEADNVFFTCLTMNPQPMHLDAHYSETKEFGKPLVNSLYTLGLVVGIAVYELTLGTTVANLGFTKVNFPAPVFTGDTIWVETEVTEARGSKSRPEAGIVTFEHRARNQDDVLICEAVRAAFMRRRPAELDAKAA